jgi:hypothetical protein
MKKTAIVLVTLVSSLAYGYVYSDYQWATYNGHQYALTTNSNWTDAEAEAVAVGGHLVTINDDSENTWLTNNFGSDYPEVWIGLTNVDNQWVWGSGEPLNFGPLWDLISPLPVGSGGMSYAYLHTSSSLLSPGYWSNADLSVPSGIIELPPIPATISIDPRTLNLKSKGKWITCRIGLPEGYDVHNIVVKTIMLNGIVPAQLRPTGIGDDDGDGVAELMVKFSRSAVQALLTPDEETELTVTGALSDGRLFEGTDTIRVINPGKKVGPLNENKPGKGGKK